MYDPAPRRGPLNQQERWLYGVFFLAFVGLFVGEVFSNYEPVKLSVLLFILFWFPLLALHELGHAIVAKVLGWRVELIVIGMGRLIHSFQFGPSRIEIRLLPIEGFVRSTPQNLVAPGLKHALIYAAGPGIEVLLAGVILWHFGGQLVARSDDYVMIFWQSLAAASTVSAVLNLIPHAVQTSNGMIPNDGLGVILALLRPAEAYDGLVADKSTATVEYEETST